jgi:hypothetical protein
MQDDIEVAVEVRRETDRALLVYDGKVEVWIPKSQISDQSETNGKIESIFIPEWLATDKGLL